MKHKNSHLLVGYWSRLRKGRDVPDQGEIDPRAIKRMLSQVFILDAASLVRPLYRLAGTSLCEKFGQELRGTNFLTHWEPDSSTSLQSLLAQSLRLRQPLCLLAIAATSDNGMVEIETVLAPLSYGNGGPVRFIGMMQVLGDASPLLGRPIAFERLVGAQLIREDEPMDVDVLPPPGFIQPDHGV
ncbi:MAG: PAS domain-containing protein, partial [Alphaproteobacteria bacterium]|nr:PAS domain-containing protein [Alphaproteobacteria bacterium]